MKTRAHSMGVCIDFRACFPKENEYLYPLHTKLTFLTFDEYAQDEAENPGAPRSSMLSLNGADVFTLRTSECTIST